MKKVGAAISPRQNPNPFKDDREEHAADLNYDHVEVLKRYDSILRALVLRKVRVGLQAPFTLLDKAFTEEDIGKSINMSIIDFAVSHALQGKDYISDIQNNMQYTVLQAALILTITVTLYIDPPAFDTVRLGHLFSAVVGFSAICHLGCIIGCTILAALFNSTYSEVDGTIALL